MGGAFARVVNERHRGLIAALQGAQMGQERRHLGSDVFVDAVQAHKGIEHEQFWLQLTDGGGQRLLMLAAIEP